MAVFALPLIGISIPYITGLVSYHLYSLAEFILIHLFFAGLAYFIWFINLFFFKKIRVTELDIHPKENLKSSLIFLGLNILTSGITSYSFIQVFLSFSKEQNTPEITIFITCLLTIISAVALGMLYEYYLLRLKWKILSLNKNEQTKAVLQSQIASLEPHFLFNALGTLSSLISDEHLEATKYNQMLAQTYAYILHKKNQEAVALKEEFSFMQQYLEMMLYVHPNKIILTNKIGDSEMEHFMVTPISLQLLVENAIKHNGFTKASPLHITIEKASNNIIVRNFLQEKKAAIQISGTGLKNLNERCMFLTGRSISIIQTQTEFLVQVPLQPVKS